ncbi:hypothetical protein WICPIJ_009764 [Wickerhamomyces pijperi]|uniref:Uncharacterized protein n=1 Tax=Wickerhamomyces pijperi TaxID=599730 RepID=A0A9P8PJI2_WICPI|nr:hypothetical protein WICPIJ_009764 [Wickerhamomyces pijperi]
MDEETELELNKEEDNSDEMKLDTTLDKETEPEALELIKELEMELKTMRLDDKPILEESAASDLETELETALDMDDDSSEET